MVRSKRGGQQCPAWENRNTCGSNMRDSGSPVVPLGPGDQARPTDHCAAFAEEPDGSLAGARNPWVPLLVVALPRGSPCCAVPARREQIPRLAEPQHLVDRTCSGLGFAGSFPEARRPGARCLCRGTPTGPWLVQGPMVPLACWALPEEGVLVCGPGAARTDFPLGRAATPCGSRPDAFQVREGCRWWLNAHT